MSSVAPWIEYVLWRSCDWRAALEHLAIELASRPDSPATQRAAAELGRASEYIEPDRRRAIDVYGLAGPAERRRALALCGELGWWAGRARLAASAGNALLDEAEAWWDAGLAELCAFALAGVRSADGSRVEDLACLLGGQDLAGRGQTVAKRAEQLTGAAAADAFVMAARFARGDTAERARCLEAALAAQPGHAIAAAQLQALALASRDPALLRRFLRVRLERLPPVAWIEGTRAIGFAMIDQGAHRGFGLRMLRRALERAYDARIADIPGHLAIWNVLAGQAAIDGTRRELLPLALAGLQAERPKVDRVWLAALATEISLREGGSAIVAGAYAELVAEFAPDHPIVHELISTVAVSDGGEPAGAVPSHAVAAASAQLSYIKVDDAERARLHAEAIDNALDPAGAPLAMPITQPAPPPTPVAPPPPAPVAISVPPPEPAPPPKGKTPASGIAIPPPSTPRPAAPATAARTNAGLLRTVTIPIPAIKPSVAPKPVRARSAVSTPPPLPTLQQPPPLPPARPKRRPSNPDEVFAALRTPDRPSIPPKPADPPDAIPRSRRISIPIDVRIVLADGRSVDGHSRDISTSGLFVIAQAPVQEGDVQVVLQVPGEEAFSEQEFRARGRIARRDADGVGVTLVEPAPALVAALAALIDKP